MKGRKQTEMEGGQSGTYLRQMRALSSPWVSIAKTYRDETILLLKKATVSAESFTSVS